MSVRFALRAPVAEGVNRMLNVHDAPPARGFAQVVLRSTKSPAFVPEIAAVRVRLAEPVFVSVALSVRLLETATPPKAKGDGLKPTIGTPAEENTFAPMSCVPLRGLDTPAISFEGTKGVIPPETPVLVPPPCAMLPPKM